MSLEMLLFLFFWLLSEAICIWLILRDRSECYDPDPIPDGYGGYGNYGYGGCGRSERESTDDRPNFYRRD
jgi:hypothetical protein